MNNKFCEQCGTSNPAESSMCLSCGRQFSNTAPQNTFNNPADAPDQPPVNNFAPSLPPQSPNNFAPPNSNLPGNSTFAPPVKKSNKGLLFGLLGCGGLLLVSIIGLVVAVPLLQVAEILPKPLFGSTTPSRNNTNLDKTPVTTTANTSNSTVVSNTGNTTNSKLLIAMQALKQVGNFKQTAIKQVAPKDFYPLATEVLQLTYTDGSKYVASTNGVFTSNENAANSFDAALKSVTNGGGTIYSNEAKDGTQVGVYKFKDFYFIEVCSKTTCSRNNSDDLTALKSFAAGFGKALENSSNSAQSTDNTATKTISGGVVNDKAANLVKPVYPAAARAVRASGAVNVQVTIDTFGNVETAEALSGHPLLKQAAVDAARASKFKPTILDGQTVKVKGTIVYNFEAQ